MTNTVKLNNNNSNNNGDDDDDNNNNNNNDDDDDDNNNNNNNDKLEVRTLPIAPIYRILLLFFSIEVLNL